MTQPEPEYKPVKVYTSTVESDISVVKLALQRNGIPFELTNANFAAWIPGVNGLSQVDVLVNECDENQARKIVADQFKEM